MHKLLIKFNSFKSYNTLFTVIVRYLFFYKATSIYVKFSTLNIYELNNKVFKYKKI
nr:MAG TPA: hypothetical protein [Caudoviricetes sp.]